MQFLSRILALTCLMATAPLLQANPAQADLIRSQWQEAIQTWSQQANLASTPEARSAVMAKRPDALEHAGRMWKCIGNSLDKEWTLEPASWLIHLCHGLPRIGDNPDGAPFKTQIDTIKKAVLAHHLESPGLVPMCMALAKAADPLSLTILEKIDSTNPDPKVQGVAALGAAIVLKQLGDEPELMRKRLTHIRKAIIESADVEIGPTTVANLAENELYQIRYLSKGRIAPDLSGTDSAGRPFRLSDYHGKVVVLVFWSSTIAQADHTLEFTRAMAGKFRDKPVVVVGVNHDPLANLRAMVADESVTWRNFSDPENRLARQYRVGAWPMTYVLDGNRKIHYSGVLGTFTELTAEALTAEAR